MKVFDTLILGAGPCGIRAAIILKEAGLDTLTGASAEILVDSVREEICPNKVSTADWIRIITEAHEVGIKSSATMMYGTVETWEDRIDHLFILRDIQRKLIHLQ